MKDKRINNSLALIIRIFKIFLRITFYLLFTLAVLVILLYIPPIQTFVAKKATNTLSNNINGEIHVGALNLNLFGNLILKDVYIKDASHNELFHVNKIDLEISLIPLLYKKLNIDHLVIDGFRSNLEIDSESSTTNFDFVMDAFMDDQEKQNNEPNQWNISINEVSIEKSSFSLKMINQLFLEIEVGKFEFLADKTDLENLNFKVDNIELHNSNVSLELKRDSISQSEPDDPATEKTDPQMGNIIAEVGQIDASNLGIHLNVYDNFNLDTSVPEFSGDDILFNLKEHLINSSSIQLSNSKAVMAYMEDSIASKIDTLNISTGGTPFIEKFVWNINSQKIDLEECEVKFDNHSMPDTLQVINFNHFDFKGINLSLRESSIAKQHLETKIEAFRIKENKGFELQELRGRLYYKEDMIALDDIQLNTPNSSIQASASVQGISLSQPEVGAGDIAFNLNVDKFLISSNDINFLLTNNFLSDQNIEKLHFSIIGDGRLDDFEINEFSLIIDDSISGELKGLVRNILNPEEICFNPLNVKAHVKTPALIEIYSTLDNPNLELPEELNLTLDLNGCYNALKAQLRLQSTLGDLALSLDYLKPARQASDSMHLILESEGFEIGSLLNLDSIGKIYFRNESVLTGLTDSVKSFDIKTMIDTAYVNHKPLHDLNLHAFYDNNNIDLMVESGDSLLNLNLDAKGHIKDSLLILYTNLNLNKVDLYALGFVEDTLKISAHISSELTTKKDLFTGSFKITDVDILSEHAYALDSIFLDLYKKNDSSYASINSDFIDGYVSSDIPLNKLSDRILDFYIYHFVENDTSQVSEYSGNLNFSLSSDESLENFSLLIPGLNELQFSKLEGEINESLKTSNISLYLPKVTYRDVSFDSIFFNMNSRPERLNYILNIKDLYYQNYDLQNFNLSGQTEFGSVKNILLLKDAFEAILVRVGFNLNRVENGLVAFEMAPDSLIINSKLWSVKGDNKIILDKESKINGNLNISDGQQSLGITVSDTLYTADIVAFQLVNLSRLLQNFNPDFSISGELNMKSDAYLGNEGARVSTNMELSDFTFQETHFGNISIKAGNESNARIAGELLLVNGNNNFKINGIYDFNNKSNPIDADVNIQFNEIGEFKSFANNLVSDPQGKVLGNVSIAGGIEKLNVNGDLDLNSVRFLLTQVNNYYKIQNASISIENNRFVFNDFTLLDSADNSFIVNGSIHAPQFRQFDLNIGLKANQFKVYNANKLSNPNLYGTLLISLDASIKGTFDDPNIWLDLSIDRGTNMTYALPPKNFDLVDSEGVVEFVNLSDPDSVQDIGFEQYIGDTIFSKLNWIDLNAILKIDKSAEFLVDMDPISGDYIRFGGSGNLNLLVQKNQNPQITGTYEFDRGIYEVSFYGLVKKTFEFEQGSSISWSGDPYSARLLLKARHNIRTASIGLVSREIYGLSDEEKSKYRRALPYSVEININGRLNNPEISFGIDLPEENKSAYPLVESKLYQLAEPGSESELTRQVFGLLTIGSFIPETTGPGGGGNYGSAFATTAAANSLNSILSNELNKLSGKYITFADLDIGMQTFSDMAGGGQTSRTTMDIRLSKKLFNDRVTIEAQSSFDLMNESDKYKHASEQSSVQSDFAIIYDLTEKGDYKLKAFERSAYDIIYKDTRMGGVAVIFIKEFDKYKKERKSKK